MESQWKFHQVDSSSTVYHKSYKVTTNGTLSQYWEQNQSLKDCWSYWQLGKNCPSSPSFEAPVAGPSLLYSVERNPEMWVGLQDVVIPRVSHSEHPLDHLCPEAKT